MAASGERAVNIMWKDTGINAVVAITGVIWIIAVAWLISDTVCGSTPPSLQPLARYSRFGLPTRSSFLTRMFAGRTAHTKAGGFIECRPHAKISNTNIAMITRITCPGLREALRRSRLSGIVVCTPGQTVTPSTNMCDVRQLCRPTQKGALQQSL